MTAPERRPPRIVIQDVRPQLDCGRWAPTRRLGDPVLVTADFFGDGHEVLCAVVRYRRVGSRRWREASMEHLEADRWGGEFVVDELGRWCFTVEAWVDRFASWRRELERKAEATQQDLASELAEGVALLGGLVERLKGEPRTTAEAALDVLRSSEQQSAKVEAALAPELAAALDAMPDRFEAT